MPGYSMSRLVSVSRFVSCSVGSWVKTTSDSPRSGSSLQEQVDAGLQLVRDAAEGQAGLGRARGPAAAHGRTDSSAAEHQIAPPSGSRTSSSNPRSSAPAAASAASCSSLAAWASTSE